MGWIQRKDANHILRNLSVKFEWIAKQYCRNCNQQVFNEINQLLEHAEKEIWKLKQGETVAIGNTEFKKGVKIRGVHQEMAAVWPLIAGVYGEFGRKCIITSVCDGEHESIVHYLGCATDFRINHVPSGWHEKLANRIKDVLTDEFDVVLEDDHIHVEMDPRNA